MRTPSSALMASAILVTMCLISIGAVEFWGNADTLNKIVWPIVAVWATFRCGVALLRDAIAMDLARTKNTPDSERDGA